jgi:hypothetical protein
MNRALERGPLSVARSGLYRSGQRLDPLVGSGPWMATHRYHGNTTSESFPGCRAGTVTEPVQLCSPSCLRWSIHYRLHSRTNWTRRGPAGLEESFFSRGFPDWRADRMQRLDSMRKLS